MLEINKITKIYETAGFTQKALDGVSIKFRETEFVSILGPSGSGKTTLLNIIGGLDQYNSGDLIINGISTKNYKDRDWDTYRNHRVGFVFQNYNLIPHQTILANVELALTLSGISKGERIKKAKEALKSVGLEKHMNKKPNQLSGGQMQRVAIARALINDPDIILADEPTGALDSKTSTQIMKLLKDVASTKLVVMVTHNSDLAKEYSTRIVGLQDGKIVSDTNPLDNVKKEKKESNTKVKKTKMSFLTALGLSFNNLLTKKGRTILTSFAGSIGIIGIALILSLSNGFQNYIDKLQEDTLTSYPLMIASETMDFSSMMISMMEASEIKGVKEGHVKESQQFTSMFSTITTNDLKSFKKYIEENQNKFDKNVKSINYNYSIDPNIYTKKDGKIVRVNPNSIFASMFGGSSVLSTFSNQSSVFVQASDGDLENIKDNYKVVEGSFPKEKDEMLLVLPNKNSIPDLVLYLLGIRDVNELYDIMSKVMTGEKVDINNEPLEFEYKDFLNFEYKLINKTNLYKYNSRYGIYEDMSEDDDYVKKAYDKGLTLKIVGVAVPKEDGSTSTLSGGLIYRSSLIDYIIEESSKTDIVKKQMENEDIDVFSNTKFTAEKKSNIKFEDLITIDNKLLESAFGIKLSEDDIENLTGSYIKEISNSITGDNTKAKELFKTTLETITKGSLKTLADNPTKTIDTPFGKTKIITNSDAINKVNKYLESDEVNNLLSKIEKEYLIPVSASKAPISSLVSGLVSTYIKTFNETNSSLTTDENDPAAIIDASLIDGIVSGFLEEALVDATMNTFANKMIEAKMQSDILSKVGELTGELVTKVATSFNVEPEKIASAFKFNLTNDEMKRLMSTMNNKTDANQFTNLINLGYQDLDEPTSISLTFYSFTSKQNFLDTIDEYNKKAEKNGEDDKVIRFTDTTGILMSSVKKIVDSVSYVLIAFVSIALIVSSIMIGIITYISVLERTKEIGILRAIGASKKNISSIFNAETFIIGLLSGLLGIGFTLAVIPPINSVIHSATGNNNINASLPVIAAIILIILSIILTLIGGLIPAKIASRKDPVEALRTE